MTRRTRATVFYLLLIAIVLAGLEAAAFVALSLRPTGNPLAFSSDEAALHIFYPKATGHYFGVKSDYWQTFRSDEFDTRIRTNDGGFREDAEAPDTRPDIAFAGDSFTFGHGVDAGERYSDRLRTSFPGLSILSLAYPNGSAPPHYYLYLKQHPELIPRLLVVGLFAWNDLRGDMEQTLLVRNEAGELVRTAERGMAVNPDGFLVPAEKADWVEPRWRRMLRETNSGRLSLLVADRLRRSLPRERDAPENAQTDTAASGPGTKQNPRIAFEQGRLDSTAELALSFVARTAELVRQHGGRTLVFYIPASYRVGEYRYFCETYSQFSRATCSQLREDNGLGEALAQWFGARGIPVIDPTASFRAAEAKGERLYFDKDGHWTRRGHALAGEILATAATPLID